MTILQHFPEQYTPRPAQEQILQGIEKALNRDTRFIIVQAPTGCGKSHIVATLANYAKDIHPEHLNLIKDKTLLEKQGDCYVNEPFIQAERSGIYALTTTKYLQNQYDSIFRDVQLLKGKQNYRCNLDETFSVNVAPCVLSPKIGDQCIAKDFCSYYTQLNKVFSSKFRATNYSKYLCLPSITKHCDILICDEASEIEDAIIEKYSVTLNYKKLAHLELKNVKPLASENPTDVKKWLSNIKQSAGNSYNTISESIKNVIHSSSYIQGEVSRLNNLRLIIDQIDTVLDNWVNCKYIVVKDNDNITITPLYIDTLAEQLFSYANKVVFLSSTVYDANCFVKTLGIKKFEYIEHPGVFDSDKSPIYAPSVVSLNHNNLDQTLPIVIKQIQEICELYPDSKGLIHTHTNAITQAIQRKIKSNRLLYKTDNFTNDHLLYEHKSSSKPTVIVSPSLAFGTDLPDDLCRFQIIVKLPYPSLGNKRVNILAKDSSDWYQSKMFTKLIQMCGRGTRNEFDYCDTFILDGNFIRVSTDNWNKLPLFFKDRLK